MISKADILKFVKHVYKRERGVPDRRLIHPRREWLIGVAVTVVLIAVGSVWSVQSFSVYSNLDKRNYEVPQTIPVYNESLIMAVLKDYNNREYTYSQLNSPAPQPVSEVPVDTVTSTTTASTTTEITESEDDESDATEVSETEAAPEPEETEEPSESSIDIVS